MSEWKPIASAPKDGRWILILDSKNMDCVWAAQWLKDAKPPYQWGTIDGRYHADLPDQWCEIPAHISLSEPLPRAMTRDGLDIDERFSTATKGEDHG